MPDEHLREILVDLVALLDSMEQEIRALQILTTHRVDANTVAKLAIPETANALHVQVQALRGKVRDYSAGTELS